MYSELETELMGSSLSVNTLKNIKYFGYGITIAINLIDLINSIGSNMYNPSYNSFEKIISSKKDLEYYFVKTVATLGVGALIGKAGSVIIGALVTGGLSVGITIVGVIAAIALVALASYLVSKGLEWLDEKYEDAKKEWFE